MDDLNNKLRGILSDFYDIKGEASTIRFNHDGAIAQIQQAYKEAGYGTTPVLGTEDTQVLYYFDREDKTWKKMREDFMTGQEWYERFISEIEKPRPFDITASECTMRMLEAAKKASGIS